MTELQIKVVKIAIVTMMGLSIFQALTIRRLVGELDRGRERFNQLHGAADYLLTVLENNNIEMTDFDVIALTSLLEETNNAG